MHKGAFVLSSFLVESKIGIHLVMDADFGASDVTRTRDLLITSEMHYRLCYTSISLSIIMVLGSIVNCFSHCVLEKTVV